MKRIATLLVFAALALAAWGQGTMYTITTSSAPAVAATVFGGGVYAAGDTATLYVRPTQGYYFDRWLDGNTQNPRKVVVTGDATYTASLTQSNGPMMYFQVIDQQARTMRAVKPGEPNQVRFRSANFRYLDIPDSVMYQGNMYSVTEIGDEAFSASHTTSYCTGLRKMHLPKNLRVIGDHAFYDHYLRSDTLRLPDSLRVIGEMAFAYSFAMPHVIIPPSVSCVGVQAFIGCRALRTFEVDPRNEHYVVYDNALLSHNMDTLLSCPAGRPGDYEIPCSVRFIHMGTFNYCDQQTSITCHSVVPPVRIGDEAYPTYSTFYRHPATAPLYVPCGEGVVEAYQATEPWSAKDSVTYAMSPCDSLVYHTITVQSDDNSQGYVIGGGCFLHGDTAYLSAVPYAGYRFTQWNDGSSDGQRSVVVVSDSLFTAYFAEQPASYTLTVESNNATYGTATGGGTYFLDDTATLVATAAQGYHFVQWSDGNTDNPRQVVVAGDATYTAQFAQNTGIQMYFKVISSAERTMRAVRPGVSYDITIRCETNNHLDIPDSVLYQGNMYSVTEIGDNAFSATYNSSLRNGVRSMHLPANLRKIGMLAFYDHYQRSDTVRLPDSLRFIGEVAFGYNFAMPYVSVPERVSVIQRCAFGGCRNLTAIDVNRLNPYYTEYDGLVLSSNFDTLVAYPAGRRGTCVIPCNVRWLMDGIFNNTNLTSITILSPTPAQFCGYINSNTSIFYSSNIGQIYVPCGLAQDYRIAPIWSEKASIITEGTPCDSFLYNTVSVYSDNLNWGYAQGTGCFRHGDTATVRAYPYPGYFFLYWSNGSTDSVYSFAVTQDTVLTAYFSNCATRQLVEVEACDSLEWEGMVFHASGDTLLRYTNVLGCDSLVHLAFSIFPSPTITLTPDTAILAGESVTLSASGAEYYQWLVGDSVVSASPTLTVAPATTTCYHVLGGVSTANMVQNGDFEQGNTGFTSAYTYTSNLYPSGVYYVGNNAHTYHGGFTGTDHTTGHGNFFICNGSSQANTIAWQQTIQVEPHTTYAFSAWLSSVSPYPESMQALLQFSINGTLLGQPFRANTSVNVWEQFYEIWNSGDNTQATITLVNQCTAGAGNDFGLDDISLHRLSACMAEDSVWVCVGARIDSTVCDSQLPVVWNGVTFTTAGSQIATLSAHGQDSIVLMTLHVKASTSSTAACTACDSYLWNGVQYSSSGTYSRVSPNAAGCDSTATLELTINQSTSSLTTHTACDSYAWNGQTYTTTGTYTYSATNSVNCDSTATLELTVNHSTASTANDTIVENQLPRAFNGEMFTQAGSYAVTIQNAVQCDSAIAYHLHVWPNSTQQFDSTICDSQLPLLWSDSLFTSAGQRTTLHRDSHGADSLVTLTLTVRPTYDHHFFDTVCQGQTSPFGGNLYGSTGTYAHSYLSVHNCDSISTLHLGVHAVTYDTMSDTILENQLPYTFNGHLCLDSGTFAVTIPNAMGCDSNICFHLAVHRNAATVLDSAVCDSQLPFLWDDTIFTAASPIHTKRLLTRFGADSVVTMRITVHPTYSQQFAQSVCDDALPFSWQGFEYDASPDTLPYSHEELLTQSLLTQHQCDSTLSLNLSVRRTSASNAQVVACDSYTWNGIAYSLSGSYNHHTLNALGCDSLMTLELTLHRSDTSEESAISCGPYLWNGQECAGTGTYEHRTQTAHGCDSLCLLHLRVPTIESERSEAHCDSLRWNAELYTASGTYTQQFTSVDGCDSVATLQLTIHRSSENREQVTLCEGDLPYQYNGITYPYGTQRGEQRIVYTDRSGCDSVILLQLDIYYNPVQSVSMLQYLCREHEFELQAALTPEAGPVTWSSAPYDPTTIGREHDSRLLVSPHQPTVYTAQAEVPGTDCRNSLTVTVGPIVDLEAGLSVTPEFATPQQSGLTLRDQSRGTVRAWQWQADGDEVCDRPVCQWSYPLEKDSVEITLIVTEPRYNCRDTARTVVRLLGGDLFAPNAFTPDESTNQRFVVRGKNIVDFEISIYARNGQRVYYSVDMDEGWDGRNQAGEPCGVGAYVYLIRYTTTESPRNPETRRGSVLLLR